MSRWRGAVTAGRRRGVAAGVATLVLAAGLLRLGLEERAPLKPSVHPVGSVAAQPSSPPPTPALFREVTALVAPAPEFDEAETGTVVERTLLVVDAGNERSIEAAELTASVDDGQGGSSREVLLARTGADGRVTVRGTRNVVRLLRAPGRVPWAIVLDDDPPRAAEVRTIALVPECRLSGRVVDEAGEPIGLQKSSAALAHGYFGRSLPALNEELGATSSDGEFVAVECHGADDVSFGVTIGDRFVRFAPIELPGSLAAECRVVLRIPPEARLAVRVIDRDRLTVHPARVRAVRRFDHWSALEHGGLSDRPGIVALSLPATGSFEVERLGFGEFGVPFVVATETAEVAAGGSARTLIDPRPRATPGSAPAAEIERADGVSPAGPISGRIVCSCRAGACGHSSQSVFDARGVPLRRRLARRRACGAPERPHPTRTGPDGRAA
ncbi:MAG: hypothetical protein EXS13_05285 [Planctomycetes bacterium]|nr:hypothetical protein [Planctomycetota bacterium]